MSIPISEELDFHYLLSLMPLLRDIPEYHLLPELFSVIGEDALIELCGFAGGETFRLPTIEELTDSLYALRYYYNVFVRQSLDIHEVPPEHIQMVIKIRDACDAGDS